MMKSMIFCFAILFVKERVLFLKETLFPNIHQEHEEELQIALMISSRKSESPYLFQWIIVFDEILTIAILNRIELKWLNNDKKKKVCSFEKNHKLL
jgi:hypothetical protein